MLFFCRRGTYFQKELSKIEPYFVGIILEEFVMKRSVWFAVIIMMILGSIGCGSKERETWVVTCPWAETGVAAKVNEKTSAKAEEVSKQFILEPIVKKGDISTVNEWFAGCDAQSKELVFAGEGMFAIAPTMNPDSLEFNYDDFTFIENLYSSIFVLSAKADLDLHSPIDVQMYMTEGKTVKVAVNGNAGSEGFLTYAFFGSMSHEDDIELVICSSADAAAKEVASGRADFAVSHQSQILEAYESGKVTIIGAFDGEDITEGPFAGVEGLGKYGYPYFRNRCFVMAPKGIGAGSSSLLKSMYDKILEDKEIIAFYDEMMIEIDPMTEQEVREHLDSVKKIVEGYRSFFQE